MADIMVVRSIRAASLVHPVLHHTQWVRSHDYEPFPRNRDLGQMGDLPMSLGCGVSARHVQ